MHKNNITGIYKVLHAGEYASSLRI